MITIEKLERLLATGKTFVIEKKDNEYNFGEFAVPRSRSASFDEAVNFCFQRTQEELSKQLSELTHK